MPADPRGDDELVRSFLDGNQAAFAELMTRHEDRIFVLAFRMTGDRADALDATQDAFLSAFRQLHRFRFDSAFGTWLYRIATNACYDLLRKRNRWAGDEADAPEQSDDRGSHLADAVAVRLDLSEALAALPEEYRVAVVMHDIGGIPYDEIARTTDTQIGTVKSRISRGRRRLAELLEQRDPSTESKA